ncbi:major facilitator superfamily domain-containing protein [Calycina marina]|uniref:Major facilitator superfamily domain-containing protein n=1 Tax=Calycina marina TaxID=1763456 RepID=A0A9P7Z9Z9_9HELO|nr:major facilitator superfamily domain-containing protein [Calycina marina]
MSKKDSPDTISIDRSDENVITLSVNLESGIRPNNEKVDSSNVTTGELEKWNGSKTNVYRYLATLFSFIIMGMNDAAYGALIPYLENYYNVSYTYVSLVFLSPFIGYALAAILNSRIHTRFGQLGVAVIAPSCKIIAYVVTCTHPPYAVLPVILVFTGFGNGIEDGGWNAWVGNMESANELLGFLHGAYGLGATISPLIATSMVAKGHLQWFTFYYLMLGLAVIEGTICILAFRRATRAKYRASNPAIQNNAGCSRTKEALLNPITWICAFFLLLYVGVEVALGGWIVTFMIRIRNGEEFASGMAVTGFWLGLTIGRIILGFVTGRLGEKFAITAYLLVAVAFEICFWLIPSFISSAIFAGLLGFFLGPLFPAAIIVATKLLPQRLHVSAIGFAAAFGGGGAALFPFIVGAIAQEKGVQALQPVTLALLVAILLLWCLLPGGFSKMGLELVQKGREGGKAAVIEEGKMTLVQNLRDKMGIV